MLLILTHLPLVMRNPEGIIDILTRVNSTFPYVGMFMNVVIAN